MPIISRYIAVTWLRLWLLCQIGFIATYLVLDMMERIPRFLRLGGAADDIIRFFIWKLPEMFGQTAAFTVLMATLLTFGLMSMNSEITAMKSCGISLLELARPMLALGFIATLALFVNAELITPRSYEKMARIEQADIRKRNVNAVFKRNNIWFRSDDNRILQANVFEPETNSLKGVVVWTLGPSMTPLSRMDADVALPTDSGWMLKNVELVTFGENSRIAVKQAPSACMDLNLKVSDLRILDKNADNLSYRTLKEYAHNLEKSGYEAFRYKTMMHSKLSAPFAAIVMVALGIPFALRNSRSGGITIGIAMSVAIGFAYFLFNAMLLSYGRSGVLPPVVAAWGANFIFTLSGVWLAMTVKS